MFVCLFIFVLFFWFFFFFLSHVSTLHAGWQKLSNLFPWIPYLGTKTMVRFYPTLLANITYFWSDLPSGCLWKVVDFQLLFVALECLGRCLRLLLFLHYWSVPQLRVDLLRHLLRDGFGLQKQETKVFISKPHSKWQGICELDSKSNRGGGGVIWIQPFPSLRIWYPVWI